MAFEFKKRRPKGAGSKLDDRDMADRIKREQERFELATDPEYWVCLCFRTEAERERFHELTGVPLRRFATGEEMRRGTERFRPAERKRTFLRVAKSMAKTPDPLAGVDYSQDLEKSSYDEAMALKAALMAAKAPDPLGEVTDTDVWTCCVFRDREDAQGYLADHNLHKHGDKWLDASSWLREIEGMARQP